MSTKETVVTTTDREVLMNLVHEAIREGLDRDCDDTGEGALCQHIGDWLDEAGVRAPAIPAEEAETTIADLRQQVGALRLDRRENYTRQAQDMRERQVLSRLLRGMARRLGALRRDYNLSSVDPWENPDYCANATPASPCGPALRVSGLCVECLHAENQKLREALAVAEGISTMPVADQVVERVARKLHETSTMSLYTWDQAAALRGHGDWHDTLRERARAILALAARPRRDDEVAAWIKRHRDEYAGQGFGEWESLNSLLDDYRLHADTGTPLSERVDEGGYGAAALSGEATT